MNNRILLALLLCASLLGPTVAAAPVADALQRPALQVRQPERAVLLSAARAGERIVAVGERGIITVSDDGGTSWRQVASPVAVTLTAVRFADARNGVVVGHGGTVLTTTDGGEHWVRRLDGVKAAGLALEAARASGDEARIRSAGFLISDGPDKPFFDVLVFDARRMLVVGAYGLAFHTEDGGESWTSWMDRVDNPMGLHLYAARRRGDTLLLAGEQGLLLRSADGGDTFERLDSPYEGSYFTAELPAEAGMLVAGLRGNVWRSPDGGASWTRLESPMPASITASTVGADGAVLLANQAGFVLRLSGETLTPINRKPLPMPSALLEGRDGQLMLLGIAGVVRMPPAKVAQ